MPLKQFPRAFLGRCPIVTIQRYQSPVAVPAIRAANGPAPTRDSHRQTQRTKAHRIYLELMALPEVDTRAPTPFRGHARAIIPNLPAHIIISGANIPIGCVRCLSSAGVVVEARGTVRRIVSERPPAHEAARQPAPTVKANGADSNVPILDNLLDNNCVNVILLI